MATGSEIASAYVAITVKAPGLKRDITKELGGVDMSGAGQQMGQRLADGMQKAVKVAGVTIAAVLGTALVKGFGRLKAIETAEAKMRGLGFTGEQVTAAMDAALGSVKGTAFGLGEAATVAGQMMAANIKPGKDLQAVLATVANNASAAGVGMDEMGSIFAKAATQANGVQNDVIGQLADKGIPIYQALAEQMGVTAGEVFKMASEGKISFEMFQNAATSAAGTVAIELGKTTTGAFDNMTAALGRFGAKLLQDIFPLIGPLFTSVTEWLDKAATAVEPMIDNFNTFLRDTVTVLGPAFAKVGENLRVAFEPAKPLLDGIKAVADKVFSEIGPVTADLAEKIPGMLIAASVAVRDFSTWLQENAGRLGAIAVLVTTIMIPVFIRLGVQAIASGVKQVAAWTMSGAGAIKTGVVYVAQSYKMIGTWVAHSVAAMKSGAETVAIWAMLRWDAIKAGAAYVVQSARIAGAWVVQSAAAALSGGKQIAVFVASKAALVGYKVAQVAMGAAAKVAAAGQWVLNAAMSANPITIIILAIAALVAGLVWFFTQTKLGQEIWANFTQFLTEAWTNITTFLTEAWTNIVAFATTAWEALGTFFTGLWDGIKAVFSAVVNWVVDAFMNWTVYGLIIKNWDAIKQFFVDTWTNITTGISTAINWVSTIISDGLAVIQMVWDRIWNGVVTLIATVWAGIKNTVQTMITFITTKPGEAFAAARDAIGDAWKGIQDLAKKPVKFVVETVINGLIDTINKIPGVNLAKVALPKGFAGGGILPGMSRMGDGDDQLIAARRGEGVMVSEALRTSADRAAFLAVNAAGRSGVGFASMLQGLARGGLVHPMPGAGVTTEFNGYPGHTGIDLAKPQGTAVQAAAAGVVTDAGWKGMGGNMVYIDHGTGLSTRYAHMLSNIAVKVGQRVKAGQQVGSEGSTGNSTGPHLHYEVLENGRFVNPRTYLEGGGMNPLAGIIDGLIDWAGAKFKGAFPDGGMFIDAAGGLMKQGVSDVSKWAMDLLSVGGTTPLLYDNGGWLDPGTHLVQNKSGRPEPILTGAQWDAVKRGGKSESAPSEFHWHEHVSPGYTAEDRLMAAAPRIKAVMNV